jgi:excisionase family DNA binding protein
MRKSSTNDDVLSTREAAERLGVALRTVQLWVESGVLPAWKTAGGHRRISRTAVERLIEERRNALAGDGRAERSDAGARFSVMVVEDEPQLLQLLLMTINGWELPLEVCGARDGFDALLQMGRNCPDLLITDLNMPGMDGFRMIASLRAQGAAFDAMDIVVVTALSEAEIAERGGLPEGVRVFHKPVPYDHIEQLVRDRLGGLAAAA